MIYGHIPPWMAKENPAFAKAVSDFYSIEKGVGTAAAIGEAAWHLMAIDLLDRDPLPSLAYGPLLGRVAVHIAREQEAWCNKDYDYLQRQTNALKLHIGGRIHEWTWVEYIWEAYYFLRMRDGSTSDDKGSGLPFKDEVKRKAALVRAFCKLGFQSFLFAYLRWEETSLTRQQLERIEGLQKHYLRKGTSKHWRCLLELAGLKDLPQLQAGGRHHCL